MNRQIRVWPACYWVDGDIIWLVHGSISVLVKYSISASQIIDIYHIPNCDFISNASFCHIEKFQHKLFLIPSFSNNIILFHIDSCEFEIVNTEGLDSEPPIFCKAFRVNNLLYLFPFKYNKLVSMNMETLELRNVFNFSDNKFFSDNKLNICDVIRLKDNSYITVFPYKCYVGIFSVEDVSFKTYNLSNSENGYVTGVKLEDNIIFSSRNNRILSFYKMNNDEFEFISEHQLKDGEWNLLSVDKDRALVSDIKSGALKLIDKNMDIFDVDEVEEYKLYDYTSYFAKTIKRASNESNILFNTVNNAFFVFERDGTISNWFDISLDEKSLEKIRKIIYLEGKEKKRNHIEMWLYSLQDFIHNII